MTTKLTTETPLGTSLSSLVQGFALTKRTEGKSTRTVDYYRDNLKRFVWYAEAHGWSDDITLITAWHVREFLGYVATEKRRWKTSSRSGGHSGCKASLATLHHYFVVLSTFFNWVVQEDFLSDTPMNGIKVARPKPKLITPYTSEEIKRLLAVCDHDYIKHSRCTRDHRSVKDQREQRSD